MNKIRVGILCGGKSAEHEVSLQSARNIVDAMDREKYDVLLIGIDKQGQWFLGDSAQFFLNADNPQLIALNRTNELLSFIHCENGLVSASDNRYTGPLDVVFPVMHGPYGEDGTMQGLLKLANIPFVGAGVLGSAVGMDKDVMKRLLQGAGIPVARYRAFHRARRDQIDYDGIMEELGFPCFIKPSNMGSSVGVSKAEGREEFKAGIDEAFRYDHKIIIEEFIKGREIECSVLGNQDPIVSLPGEVLPQHDFYTYEAKYIDENGAHLQYPADLPEHLVKEFQALAIESFHAIECEGMARVDCFLTEQNALVINELNTMPGFTKISMYPKLWEISGIPYSELIDRLIQLAIERHERDRELEN
ncbi:MAG: D-alanine--D-alanine ligase [Gemmatimonadota bacterium]|nr:D-alanine--D-alanine ligase [Gemmatimonadota bacterium]